MAETATPSNGPISVILTTLSALPVLGVVGLILGLVELYMAEHDDRMWQRGQHKCVTFAASHTFYLATVMVILLV